MRHSIFFICLFVYGIFSGQSQVLTTNPVFPTESDSVTVIFDASKGSGGLANYTGDIWAHTGVITNLSTGPSNWKYVVADWEENTDKAKLKSLGNNLWELKIGPSIRSYYGVPASEKILKLAFVFRNSNGSLEGKDVGGLDLFINVVETGLNVVFVKPDRDFLAVNPESYIDIQVSASSADSIVLFHDGIRLTGGLGNSLSFSLQAGLTGYHFIEAKAYGNGLTVTDIFYYLIKGEGVVEALPAGVKDGINYIDDHSAILVLFAPQKDFAFLIGEFNDWKIDESYLMKKTPDGSRYWFQLENLDPDKEYQFQYLVDGDIRIADPYSDKISDPWRDGDIDQSTYPDLIPYPKEKTTQAVSVIQTGQSPYSWKTHGFIPPERGNLIIYELLIRDFLSAHSFMALTDTLDYIKSLGINAIELMPVSEFDDNESWGYNPSFYFAVDKYYGPKSAFKAFVDSAHSKGIAVIMDMVLNHSYGQSPLVRLYWDALNGRPSAENPWYNQQSPNTDYSWGFDFNHESGETKRFVDSVNSYWLEEYKVDGFRFDFTKGFTNTPGNGSGYDASRIAILKRMADQIWTRNPSAYIILEHFADNSEERELADYGMLVWGNSNYNYRQATSGWYSGGGWDFSGVSYKQRGWSQPHLVGYMESHDEERLMYECVSYGNTQNPAYYIKNPILALQRMELAANFFIPIPGPKMIWMFGELGYDYSINYNGRVGNKPVRWDYWDDPARKRLSQVYSVLNHLKVSNDLFATTDFQISFQDTVKRIHLNQPTKKATILGNFGVRSSYPDPHFQHDGWWYELWTGDSILINDVHGRIMMKPGEYRFYTDVKLKKPDIISGIEHFTILKNVGKRVNIYPNPGQNSVFVEVPDWSAGDLQVTIKDLQGRSLFMEIIQKNDEFGRFQLDVNAVESGVYIIELIWGKEKRFAKWIKSNIP
jgi:hypothetical protein